MSGFAQARSELIWFPELDGSCFLFGLVVGWLVWFGLVFCWLGGSWGLVGCFGFFSELLFYWFSGLNWLIEGIDSHPEGNCTQL